MLLFFHNPDAYTTGNLPLYWTGNATYGSAGGTPGVRADGYLGRPALTGVGGYGWVRFMPVNPSIHPVGHDFRAGGRFLFESAPPSTQNIILVKNLVGSDDQISVALNTDMTLSIFRGASEIQTSNQVLALDTFYRIGFKGTVRRAGGTAEAWLGSTPIMKFAGDTAAVDPVDWGGVEFGLVEDSAVNHIYIGDQFGHHPDLIPGLLVKYVQPDGDGTFNQFTPDGAATIAEALDDADTDEDTTTAQAFAAGVRATMSMDDLDATAIIYAIQPTMVARTASQSGPSVRHITIAEGGAPLPGYADVRHVLTGDYATYREMMYYKPEDGFGFYRDEFNAREFGVEAML